MGRGSRRFTNVVAWAAVCAGGCQSGVATGLALSQTPPTVRAACAGPDYQGARVRTVERATREGADYYTVRYTAVDGSDHQVVFNGAGDEIDKH